MSILYPLHKENYEAAAKWYKEVTAAVRKKMPELSKYGDMVSNKIKGRCKVVTIVTVGYGELLKYSCGLFHKQPLGFLNSVLPDLLDVLSS